MIKKALAIALASGIVSAPAMAASFVPFNINLSGTDAATAVATYNFEPGTYTITLIKDLYTAVAVANPAASNFTDYYQYSINGGAFTFYNPTNSSTRYATADAAFAAFSALPALSLYLASASTVTFQIGDSLNSLGDNAGGTSLRVTAAVPEPATWAMMLFGFGAIGYAMRRKTAVRALTA